MNHSGFVHEVQVPHECIKTYSDTLQGNNGKRYAMQNDVIYKQER
jgi:hypothetical protein